MASRKKVFLCTNIFIKRCSYYIVAEDEEQAEDAARNDLLPAYLDNCDEHLEYEDCTVDEEVATIILMKTSTISDKRPQKVCLVPTKTNDPDVYHGYLVEGEKVDREDHSYPKNEWQLVL